MAQIQAIGSGNAFGDGVRFQTCYHVNWNKRNILIDCGATSSIGLKRCKKDIDKIDVIFITHLHGDHFGGLPYLLLEKSLFRNENEKRLKIYGPQGLLEKFRTLQEALYPGTLELVEKAIILEEYHSNFVWEGFEISIYKMLHSELSNPHGFKISLNDKVLSFTGDSAWCESHISLAENADLFITECYDFNSDTPGHLNYEVLVSNLNKLKAKSIVLTHPGPDLLRNQKYLKIPLIEDGETIEF